MSAPTIEVEVVVLHAAGDSSEKVIDQRKLSELLGGPPTVVGAIGSLGVQAVAKNKATGKKNKHALPEHWEQGLKGEVVLFRTDEDASPLGFKLTEFKKWVSDGELASSSWRRPGGGAPCSWLGIRAPALARQVGTCHTLSLRVPTCAVCALATFAGMPDDVEEEEGEDGEEGEEDEDEELSLIHISEPTRRS
eukprot:4514524-Prymnesium_polylepis.1